jgi:hypothetical protein
MFRPARAVLLVVAALALSPSVASAAPDHKLGADLGALWTKVFTTPSPQNPFGSGDPATGCWVIGGILAPLGPSGVPACTVKTGTKFLIAGNTFECSSMEGDGTTFAVLAACAKANDTPTAPPVTLDGQRLALTEVLTSTLHVVLGADNVFGLPAGTSVVSVAHGWLALVNPLPPGTHTVVIAGPQPVTTVITVVPGQ